MQSAKRFILTTGGTGGHIFPAIAVAREIQSLLPDAELLFIGAVGGMENKMIPDAGFRIIPVTVSGIARKVTLKNILRNMAFPVRYLQGLWQASRILRIFHPDAVIGFGGYASAPGLRMAVSLGIPSALHESNAYPGIVTKMMAGKVDRVLLGNEAVLQYLSVSRYQITGNPVRSQLLQGSREKGLETYGFRPDQKVVFLTGGSLGARTLNEAMAAGIDQLTRAGIQVIWQCGSRYADQYGQTFANREGVRVMPFIQNMADTYACADLIISRAGAMTVSEILALRKPAILVPSPNVAEDHQTQNARSLTDKGAAVLVRDADAVNQLVPEVLDIIQNAARYARIQSALEAMSVQDAAREIARVMIDLSERRKTHA